MFVLAVPLSVWLVLMPVVLTLRLAVFSARLIFICVAWMFRSRRPI